MVMICERRWIVLRPHAVSEYVLCQYRWNDLAGAIVVWRGCAIFADIWILETGSRFLDTQNSGPDPKDDMRDRLGKPNPALASQPSGKPVSSASQRHLSTTASGLDTGSVRIQPDALSRSLVQQV
jgi:hypothetical protein